MQSIVTVTLNVDWSLLMKQKDLLVDIQQSKHVVQEVKDATEGILQIIDEIQDQGEDQGHPVYEHLEEKETP